MADAGNQGTLAPPKVKVRYPQSKCVVHYGSFFATGIASEDCDRLIGVFSKDGSNKTYIGKTLRQPPASPKWVIYFKLPDPDENATYTFRLFQQNAAGEPLEETDGIRIQLRSHSIGIAFPDNGDECCAD